MSDIFDELRIIATDSKKLDGEDRKKLVQAADEYDRMVSEMRSAPQAHPQPNAAINLDEFSRVDAPGDFCTQFVVTHTDSLFSFVFGRQRHHLKKDNMGVSMLLFEPAFVMTTSPQTAKDMVIMLTNQIIQYEQNYGQIVTELARRMSAMQPSSQQRS